MTAEATGRRAGPGPATGGAPAQSLSLAAPSPASASAGESSRRPRRRRHDLASRPPRLRAIGSTDAPTSPDQPTTLLPRRKGFTFRLFSYKRNCDRRACRGSEVDEKMKRKGRERDCVRLRCHLHAPTLPLPLSLSNSICFAFLWMTNLVTCGDIIRYPGRESCMVYPQKLSLLHKYGYIYLSSLTASKTLTISHFTQLKSHRVCCAYCSKGFCFLFRFKTFAFYILQTVWQPFHCFHGRTYTMTKKMIAYSTVVISFIWVGLALLKLFV